MIIATPIRRTRQPRRRLTFPHKLFLRFLLSHIATCIPIQVAFFSFPFYLFKPIFAKIKKDFLCPRRKQAGEPIAHHRRTIPWSEIAIIAGE